MDISKAPVTKFHPPDTRPDLLNRPALISRLESAVNGHPVTLVSAPAGYGKTTIIASYCNDHAPHPFAWVSIGDDDNDSFRFLDAIAGAIHTAFPDKDLNVTVETTYPESQNIPFAIRQTINTWINRISEKLSSTFILVLDDLHEITESAPYIGLEYLIENLPPVVKVVLSTRYDPPINLARLRARGHLGEIRTKDLRFNDEELMQFIKQELQYPVTVGDCRTLQTQIDGWPAGLRLIAYSLKHIDIENTDTLFENLIRPELYIFDYLAEEVFDRLEPELQLFLLRSSILTDLTPESCEAVTGRKDAAQILHQIFRRNLLMIAHTVTPTLQQSEADDRHLSYRYHDLFKRFLREKLKQDFPEIEPVLHRKAAGMETSIAKKMYHFLSGKMWQEAIETIESSAERLLREGLYETVKKWIQSLPIEYIDRHPKLALYLGLCTMFQGDILKATRLFDNSIRIAEENSDASTAARARAHVAGIAIADDDPERSIKLLEETLQLNIPDSTRIQLMTALARLYLYRGNWKQSATVLDEVISSLENENSPYVIQTFAIHFHPSIITHPAGIRYYDQAYRIIKNAAYKTGHPGLKLVAAIQKSFLKLWTASPTEAVAAADEALILLKRFGTGSPFMLVGLHITALQAYMSVDSGRKTEVLFEETFQTIKIMGLSDAVVPAFSFLLGKFAWLTGRQDLLTEAVSRMSVAEEADKMPSMPFFSAALQGITHAMKEEYKKAEHCFKDAIFFEEKRRISILFGSARALLVYLYHTTGRSKDAYDAFLPLLVQSKEQNLAGLVLREALFLKPLLLQAQEERDVAEYAEKLSGILSIGKKHQAVHIPGSLEKLTPREVEIIGCICDGMRNKEIAEKLYISERTVKTHVSKIMAKLDVTSRTGAAARAREFGIVN